MNFQKKRLIFLLLIGALLLSLQVKTYPAICGNQASMAYSEPTTQKSQVGDSIEDKIIAAASAFFQGRSNIQQLLVKIELQNVKGFDSATLDPVIQAALDNMQKARDLYVQIVARANQTPYNKATLALLKSFSYDELRMNEGLNRTIFAGVEKSLKKGDVTGFFKSNVKQFNAMISWLKQIKRDFAAGQVPEIKLFWQLNETASITALTGSYVARVFAGLK